MAAAVVHGPQPGRRPARHDRERARRRAVLPRAAEALRRGDHAEVLAPEPAQRQREPRPRKAARTSSETPYAMSPAATSAKSAGPPPPVWTVRSAPLVPAISR